MSTKNRILHWFFKILTIFLGIFFIVFGEQDDSPGAQMIGLVIVVAVIIATIKSIKKNSGRTK